MENLRSRATSGPYSVGSLAFTVILGFRPLHLARRRIFCGRGDLSPYALLGRFLPRLGRFRAASFFPRGLHSIVR